MRRNELVGRIEWGLTTTQVVRQLSTCYSSKQKSCPSDNLELVLTDQISDQACSLLPSLYTSLLEASLLSGPTFFLLKKNETVE